ncbi:zinc finger protein 184-like isoform X2 [Galleria mellonella]|uniref:Zinc finger protein 184-like isoform X2 n=1 Tax=Galleria mellonella TaxID=7137 RepID=A0ABM3M9M3_GALME|nr:zinc finger protein 184-like isoform X2 [Galleria mellonella]
MRDLKACRCCLITNVKLEKITDIQNRIYTAVSGLEIHPQDGYPNYLCAECQTEIKKAMHFRRKVRRAHFVMKEIMMVKKELNLSDIRKVDRRKTNLKSNLGRSVVDKHFYYTINSEDENVMNQEDLDLNTNTFKFEIKSESIDEDSMMIGIDAEVDYEEMIDNIEVTEVEEEIVNGQESSGNIDTADVFKELNKDKLENSGEELPTIEDTQHNDRNVFKTPKEGASLLSRYNVRIMSLEEQKNIFNTRLNTEPFKSSKYKCRLCIKIFRTLEELLSHVNTHPKGMRYKHTCEVCKSQFSTAAELDAHRTWTHLYEYSCIKCNKKFYFSNHAEKHRRKHKPTTRYRKKTKNVEDLANHYTIVPLDPDTMYKMATPPDEDTVIRMRRKIERACERIRRTWKGRGRKPLIRKLKCDICDETFLRRLALILHMEMAHLFKYECNHCDSVQYSRKCARKHLAVHVEEKEEPPKNIYISCQYCSRKVRKSTISFHIKRYHFAIHHNLSCAGCGLTFTNLYSLYHHQLTVHRQYVPMKKAADSEFGCTHCDFGFLTKEALQLHQVRSEHEEAKDVPNACIQCRMIYGSETEYNDHIPTCNGTLQFPGECPHCGDMINNYSQFTYHCNRKHPSFSGARRAGRLCDICGNSYTRTGWHSHRRKHHGPGKRCSHCDVKLDTLQAIFVHQVARHTRKPFHCTLCPARFQLRADCRDHILKGHAPEMPFKCEICDRDFAHVDFLVEHINKFHDIKKSELKHLRPKKVEGLVYIYPYMKVNVSKVDDHVIKGTRVYMYDFHNRKVKRLKNPEEYFITNYVDDGKDSDGDEKAVKKHKRQRVRFNDNGELLYEDTEDEKPKRKRRRIKKEGDDVDVSNGEGRSVVKRRRKKKDNVMVDSDIVMRDDVFDDDLKGEVIYFDCDDVKEEVVHEESVVIGDEKFPVMEIDGEQFVTINDVMYKIERSDE